MIFLQNILFSSSSIDFSNMSNLQIIGCAILKVALWSLIGFLMLIPIMKPMSKLFSNLLE